MEKSKRGLLLLTVIALLIAALALFISYHTFTGNAVYKTIDTSTPPIIKKGGIYEGTWINEDPTKAAIEIQTEQLVIIQNAVIKSKGNLIHTANYNVNLEIKKTQGNGIQPQLKIEISGRFLSDTKFHKKKIK